MLARRTARPAALDALVAAARGLFGPLTTRIKLGEGGLVVFNLSLLLVAFPGPWLAIAGGFHSLLVLTLMYAWNDLYDAAKDRRDPKKDQALVCLLLRHRRSFWMGFSVLSVALVLFGLAFLGADVGVWTAAVLTINAVYSLWLKSVPAIDVLCVGAWGGTYLAVAGAGGALCALAGVMTGISHIFQTVRDRRVDTRAGVATSAVFGEGLTRVLLVACCFILAAVLARLGGFVWAASALLPLLIAKAVRRPTRAWLITKGYFAVTWAALLSSSHAVD